MPHREPDYVKDLHGSGRRDRHAKADPTLRLVRVPRPPAGMGDRAAEEWRNLARQLVDLGTLTASDLRALQLLAETLALEAELRSLVVLEGVTVLSAGGSRKTHPALRLGADARNQAIRLLGEFGLTPRSRNLVDRAPAPVDPDSPWQKLKMLQGGRNSSKNQTG